MLSNVIKSSTHAGVLIFAIGHEFNIKRAYYNDIVHTKTVLLRTKTAAVAVANNG